MVYLISPMAVATLGQSFHQNVNTSGFSSSCWSQSHYAMSHSLGLVELY